MPDWIALVLTGLASSGLATALTTGFFQWQTARTARPSVGTVSAGLIEAAATLQGVLNSQAEALVAELREEVGALRDVVKRQAAEVERVTQEAEACHQRERAMSQRLRSLESWMRRNGMNVPADPSVGAFLEMSGSELTLLTPQRGTPQETESD